MPKTLTKTTEYSVTFKWTASDWKDSQTEDGEWDYDNQPCTETQVVVTLPSDSTPWEVHNAAEERMNPPQSVEGVYGWDDDGITVQFAGRYLTISGELIKPETTWADFY